MELLRKSIYPSLLCSAAQEGDLHALEKLRDAVSIIRVKKAVLVCINCSELLLMDDVNKDVGLYFRML